MARLKLTTPKKRVPTGGLPFEFWDANQNRLKKAKYNPEAIQWYLNQLTKSDVAEMDRRGLTELENILLQDALPIAQAGDPQWVAKKSLGKGSYGEVMLWQRTIGPDQRVESIACKDAMWDQWFKDYSTEAHLTRRLNAAGCDNVVRVLDWKSIPRKQVTRILYEYCPHGHLNKLLRFYTYKCRVTIPEPFLWHIFHSMAIALCYNERGTTEPESNPKWLTIVHRDLKPWNILLSDPKSNNKPLYPTVKLGDYGLAYSIPPEEDSKALIETLKRTYWSGGTRGWAAPEINEKVRSDSKQTPYPIASPRSDVFSLGCVLLAFLRIPESRYNKYAYELLELSMDYAFNYFPYSNALVTLCRQCIEPDAKKRPTAFELFQLTRGHANSLYEAVSIASQAQSTQPGSAFEGQVLWNQDMQDRYVNNDVFRDEYRAKNDWFVSHRPNLRKLYLAAMAPGREAIPKEGTVAMGNGLGPFLNLAILENSFQHLPRGDWLSEMKVYNTQGERLIPRNGRPLLRYKGLEQLEIESQNDDWNQPAQAKQPVQIKKAAAITKRKKGAPKARKFLIPRDPNAPPTPPRNFNLRPRPAPRKAPAAHSQVPVNPFVEAQRRQRLGG